LYKKKFPGFQILIPQESKAIGVTAAMPKKWYHGTSTKNAEIIMGDGYLRPDQETTYDIDIPRDGAVYIAEFDIANQYAIERGGPVLEVAAPDISKLLPDEDDVYELLNDRGGELNAKGSAQAKRVKALWLKQWNEENASYNDPDKFPIYKNFEDAWAAWGGIEFEGSSELAEQMKYLTDYIVKNDPKLARAIIELSGKAAHMGPLKVVRQVKTAAPKSIWYHGTSIKNLRSIMSQGLVPEGTEKVWADDPDAGISAPSRQSYGGCYDDLTRILTRYRGFQYFYDLLPDDEVATLVNGRELVYEKPSAFTRYWHEGLMYAFKTRLIDQMITPDHRAYWRNRISNVNRVNSGQPELNFQLSRVDSLIGSKEVKSCGLGRTKEYIQNSWRHVEFKRDAEWHCASAPQLFEVPLAPQWAIPVKERRNKFAERPEQFQFDDWLEFLGWYLSEGSLGDKSQIAISQQKLENRAEIKFLLSRMRIPFYTDKQGIRFSHHGLFEYLKQFGLAQDKFIPQEIKELAPDKLKIILSSLMKGDGSWKSKPKRKGGESGIYSSVSRRLRDDVAEIALKCGYGVSLGVGKPTIGRFKGNFPIYRVYLSKWNSTSLCGNPSIIEFKGWVSCVQVPSGVIFVERNGKTCWSGNSYVTQNLMTATGAPDTEDKKARGGSLVVIMELQPNTMYLDEDNITGALGAPIKHMSDNTFHVLCYYLAATQEGATQDWQDEIRVMREDYVRKCFTQWEAKFAERKMPFHPELKAELEKLLPSVWLGAVTRAAGHVKDNYSYIRAWDQVFYGTPKEKQRPDMNTVLPDASEGEATFREAAEKVTRTLRLLARPNTEGSQTYNINTSRINEPIGFSGSNHILAIVEVRDLEVRATPSPVRMLLHWGTIPQDFFSQWNTKFGSKYEVVDARKGQPKAKGVAASAHEDDPQVFYHGTSWDAAQLIDKEGLKANDSKFTAGKKYIWCAIAEFAAKEYGASITDSDRYAVVEFIWDYNKSEPDPEHFEEGDMYRRIEGNVPRQNITAIYYYDGGRKVKTAAIEDEIKINVAPDGRITAKHPQGVAMGTMEDRAGLANWFDWNALPKGDTGKYDKAFVLGHISVRVDARRTGLGRALVGALLDAARAQGAEVCFLTAFSLVGLSAKELDAFYTNVGFQPYIKDVYVRKLAGVAKFAAMNTISMQDAQDRKLFGPVYHGTTEERQEQIGNEGFKVYIGDAGSGDVAHGYEGNQPYHDGIPAPVHHLGYGIYFTTSKTIAKQFAGGTTRGMKTYYLDVPNYETINFGVPKTMMKWWISQGYDPQLAKTNRVEATKKLTENLKSKYDAVWFKGKGLHRLLDGDQICVFDPSRVYQVDPNLAKPGDVGSKVKRLADGMKGTIVSARSIPEDVAKQYWGGETRIYSVKWTKGGTDNNVKGSQIEFIGAPKAQGATASKVAAFYCVACDGGDCIEHESLTAAVKSNINKLTFESEENNDEYDGWTITAWAPDRMPRPYAQYEGPVGFINIGIEGASIEGPYVYDINVEDDWRGTGLGQQLYDLAVAEAKKRGYTEFNSSTDQTPEAKAAWKRLSQRYQVTRKRDKTENLPYFSLKLAAVADDVEIKVTPKQKGLEAEVWLGDQKVGFAYFHLMEDAPGNPTCPPNSLMVDAAAVSGSVQRQGVGLKMYRTLIEASGKAGYDRLYEGIDHSEEAIGLWEKLKTIYPTEFDEDWGVYYIPLRRSKTAAEGFNDEGFWAGEGNAASGVLPICTTTQRVCLAWRSPDVHIGDCWGVVGGAVKKGMTPQESAKEELGEETGYRGGITLHPAFVFHAD
jgi:GNAT superfamily N-acetyltransferase/RNA:NAD 2'-phosphotransferase (TPT1/KptA family)